MISRKEQELKELRQALVEMALLVREMITEAVRGLVERRGEPLERVEALEDTVNMAEVELDDRCVKFVALYQPEASDLRTVMMIMRMNSNLERMGDHAFNIAREAKYLIRRPLVKPLVDTPRMAEVVVGMLDDAVKAFTDRDEALARDICVRDQQVDALRDQIIRELLTYMFSDPGTIERALKLMQVAQNLERIGDLATNLAEDVVYMVTGKIIKHRLEFRQREDEEEG